MDATSDSILRPVARPRASSGGRTRRRRRGGWWLRPLPNSASGRSIRLTHRTQRGGAGLTRDLRQRGTGNLRRPVPGPAPAVPRRPRRSPTHLLAEFAHDPHGGGLHRGPRACAELRREAFAAESRPGTTAGRDGPGPRSVITAGGCKPGIFSLGIRGSRAGPIPADEVVHLPLPLLHFPTTTCGLVSRSVRHSTPVLSGARDRTWVPRAPADADGSDHRAATRAIVRVTPGEPDRRHGDPTGVIARVPAAVARRHGRSPLILDENLPLGFRDNRRTRPPMSFAELRIGAQTLVLSLHSFSKELLPIPAIPGSAAPVVASPELRPRGVQAAGLCVGESAPRASARNAASGPPDRRLSADGGTDRPVARDSPSSGRLGPGRDGPTGPGGLRTSLACGGFFALDPAPLPRTAAARMSRAHCSPSRHAGRFRAPRSGPGLTGAPFGVSVRQQSCPGRLIADFGETASRRPAPRSPWTRCRGTQHRRRGQPAL
jgi:hypothetical protein